MLTGMMSGRISLKHDFQQAREMPFHTWLWFSTHPKKLLQLVSFGLQVLARVDNTNK